MKPVEPILTVELFPPLSGILIELLKNLSGDDWSKPTVCGPWTVKDVAAHLLGGNLGRLWSHRENSAETVNLAKTFDELVALINESNAEWVRAARRISPELLVEMLELTDRRLYQHFIALDPDRPARVPVSWAGQEGSLNWFDIAREYTEKWLHQQHIREAVGAPLLTGQRWLYPALDTFMRALPYTYRHVEAADGAVVSFRLLGEAGGAWSLRRQGGSWALFSGEKPGAIARVILDQDVAWRLFTKGIPREAARTHVQIEGNQAIGGQIMEMVSIMA